MSGSSSGNIMKTSFVYRSAQAILAPGAEKAIGEYIRRAVKILPPDGKFLDVGCGPFSRLWPVGLHPIGLDLSAEYTRSYHGRNEPVITGSADELPFRDRSFDGIWSFGLLHHLPDDAVHKTIDEMVRVCRDNGYIIIFDAVKPVSAWRQPLASVIRRIDRGHYVRDERHIEEILRSHGRWTCRRVKYSLTGLEGLFCVYPGEKLDAYADGIVKKGIN